MWLRGDVEEEKTKGREGVTGVEKVIKFIRKQSFYKKKYINKTPILCSIPVPVLNMTCFK
jgi:hypothetical protein